VSSLYYLRLPVLPYSPFYPSPMRLRSMTRAAGRCKRPGSTACWPLSSLPGPGLLPFSARVAARPPVRSARFGSFGRFPSLVPALGTLRAVVACSPAARAVRVLFFPRVNAATARCSRPRACDVIIPRIAGLLCARCRCQSLALSRMACSFLPRRTIAVFRAGGVDSESLSTRAFCGFFH